MDRGLKIYCKNIERYVPVYGGESLLKVFERLKDEIPFVPICARVNNKTEDLRYPIFSAKQVEFLDISSPSSERVYIRSLCMMLYKAIHDLYPGTRLRIVHSISQGNYCNIFGSDIKPTPEVVAKIKTQMREIVECDLQFVRHEKLTSDVIEIFKKAGLDDKVLLLETSGELYTIYYTLGDISDSYYGNLVPSTKLLNVFDLIPYEEGMLLLGPDKSMPSLPFAPITQNKMMKAFRDHLLFNRVIGVSNVGELNKVVEDNQTAMLINVSEALHDKKIGEIAATITERFNQGGARIVLIAGPSSSGKTTTSKRLAIHLMTNLIKPKMLSLDNYFVNRDKTPRDETGDYDYESLYALDLETFNAQLNALIAGETVDVPTFDFESGMRVSKENKLKLEKDNVLIIEGIHGLNPELTSHIPDEMKYKVYVSALTSLSIDDHNWVPTSDNRLLRRIIRDYKYRGVSATSSITRWQSVRRGEEKWIFPFQENADATFNSSLIFELGVMKEYANAILRGVPRNVPEYAEATRLLMFLSYFKPINEKDVPSTSLLREFLGGSSFRY